jgi:diamine N-acetyltransferase
MNLKLRKADLADIPLIYSLAEKIWNVHYIPIIGQAQVDYMLQYMYSEASLTEQMSEKNHIFYLLQWQEKEIGFVAISEDTYTYIHKFYIATEMQAKGIGKLCFENIKLLCDPQKPIQLTVNRKNYKSINFYFKLGFQIKSVEDFQIGQGYEMNDFIMEYNF